MQGSFRVRTREEGSGGGCAERGRAKGFGKIDMFLYILYSLRFLFFLVRGFRRGKGVFHFAVYTLPISRKMN